MGLVTPIGADLDTFWRALLEGRSGAGPVRSFDTSSLKRSVGCEVGPYVLPQPIRRHVRGGRCTELALLAASGAVSSAGLDGSLAGRADAAIVVGTTMGDVTQFEQDRAAHPERKADERDVGTLANRPLDLMGRCIAAMLEVTGNVVTVPAACAAGSYAIGVATSLVACGRARVAVAVGCEAFSRLAFVGFARMHAMSSDVCRPFSLERPGLLLGEGAGAVVIETLGEAAARGAGPLAFVDGFGLSCDAHHVTGPHPEGAGAARAARDAIRRAGLRPDQIDYVNAHGTGTPLNDRTESLAMHGVFGEGARRVPISSIKALTGHMMGAAGAVEAIASVLAMRHSVIPPTWNWTGPDPQCDVDCVPNEPRETRLRHVVSNSYAFGGNDASLVLSSTVA
ncbi:MAG TPA: beta-ketoacyl-[acyl-carrier-protein] synthase family protein [Candidatus Polarisedimenticolia bacterium]|jgi:3-oxoacyl-[acyl-carrier-protein] synthase II